MQSPRKEASVEAAREQRQMLQGGALKTEVMTRLSTQRDLDFHMIPLFAARGDSGLGGKEGEAGSPGRKPPLWPRRAADDGAWDRLRAAQVGKSSQIRIYFEGREPSLFADGLRGEQRQTLGVFPDGEDHSKWALWDIYIFFFFSFVFLL